MVCFKEFSRKNERLLFPDSRKGGGGGVLVTSQKLVSLEVRGLKEKQKRQTEGG